MPELDQRLPQSREACEDSRLQLVDSAFTHGRRPELRACAGGESRSRGAFLDGLHHGRTTRGRARTLTRDKVETIGACALIAGLLFTYLTELPLLWLAEALR